MSLFLPGPNKNLYKFKPNTNYDIQWKIEFLNDSNLIFNPIHKIKNNINWESYHEDICIVAKIKYHKNKINNMFKLKNIIHQNIGKTNDNYFEFHSYFTMYPSDYNTQNDNLFLKTNNTNKKI